MKAKIEYTGKDVDEAITKACDKLHANREELEIEVVSTGSSGIFGLCRRKAVIKVAKKNATSSRPAPEVAEALAAAEEGGAEREGADRPPLPEAGPPVAKGKRVAKPHAPKAKTVVVAEPGEGEEPAVAKLEEEVIVVTPEVVAAIKADLDHVLTLMGHPSETEFQAEGNAVSVRITGEHVEEVVGPEGNTLDALQYLFRKIISKKYPGKIMLGLDAGEFRAGRSQELEKMALELAAEVKETGRTRTIPALNPAERRIIHMTLQDDTTIRSRSVGEGLFKKVLIYPPGKGRRKSSRKPRSTPKAAAAASE